MYLYTRRWLEVEAVYQHARTTLELARHRWDSSLLERQQWYAAVILNTLNRQVKMEPVMGKERLYALKILLMRHYYQAGCCRQVNRQERQIRCNRCRPETRCRCTSCGGTGYVRLYQLYGFVYEIGGQLFSWHIPDGRLVWPVELSEGRETEGEGGRITTVQPDLGMAILWVFLEKVGVSRTELPYRRTLRDALRLDARAARRTLIYHLKLRGFLRNENRHNYSVERVVPAGIPVDDGHREAVC
ncbi:MAG: hypothetical protein FOGNACKC_00741 [Anaerolineae bacterium]|nr:hypothetical protein [Anaerolineae bacterium]